MHIGIGMGVGLGGGAADPLLEAIIAWQGVASYVHAGGLGVATFAENNKLGPGANAYITCLDAGVSQRIRQDGFITQVKFKPAASSSTYPADIRFRVFRLNGATYDVISTSEIITIANSDLVTATLSTPLACQIGDYFGFTLTKGANAPYISCATQSGNTIRYIFDDVPTTNAFVATVANLAISIEAMTIRPYVVTTGDSIPEGQTEYKSFYDTFAGTLAHDPAYQLGQLIGAGATLRYQNHCKGAQTWAWVLSTGIVSALAAKPHTIIIMCGVNDINNARTWANVVADMDAVQVLIAAANPVPELLLCEILPWTNGDDTEVETVRTFNSNYATWATANGATLVSCHNPFGQTRVSTGELDDLKTAYNSDGVHLTLAGKQALAALWRAAL